MKRILFIIVAFLLLSIAAQAKFCLNCGENLPDKAKFCSKCGNKQTIAKTISNKKKSYSQVLSKAKAKAKKQAKTPLRKINAFYRAKTDVFLYEKRGDERNALKKNLFFKPRRYRMRRNSHFKVLEIVGASCLVQSTPNNEGRTIQGWVYNEQLSLRSDWIK